MGKNYWCEFCGRGFADILSIRKKHINSIQHQRLRKLHYDSFKDAATLLHEESLKQPCKRYFQTGQCDFGDHCKFSHRNLTDLKDKANKSTFKQINVDDINDWLEKWKTKKKIRNKEERKYRLPSGFPPVNELPPSLQPPIDGPKLEELEWG